MIPALPLLLLGGLALASLAGGSGPFVTVNGRNAYRQDAKINILSRLSSYAISRAGNASRAAIVDVAAGGPNAAYSCYTLHNQGHDVWVTSTAHASLAGAELWAARPGAPPPDPHFALLLAASDAWPLAAPSASATPSAPTAPTASYWPDSSTPAEPLGTVPPLPAPLPAAPQPATPGAAGSPFDLASLTQQVEALEHKMEHVLKTHPVTHGPAHPGSAPAAPSASPSGPFDLGSLTQAAGQLGQQAQQVLTNHAPSPHSPAHPGSTPASPSGPFDLESLTQAAGQLGQQAQQVLTNHAPSPHTPSPASSPAPAASPTGPFDWGGLAQQLGKLGQDALNPSKPATPIAGPMSGDMPETLKSKVTDLLGSDAVTADELDRAADQTEAAGYPAEAMKLRAKARELRAAAAPTPASRAPTPPAANAATPVTMTIQSGHIPSAISKYYTGDALRWKELYDPNPDLGAPNANGFPNWRVGKTITIPDAWNPGGKALPRPFSTSARPSSPLPAAVPTPPIDPKQLKLDRPAGPKPAVPWDA